MSDEYANTGTVRRRPRADHQRSQTHRQNGKGEYGANGHSRAEMDEEEFEWDEEEEEGERRGWESERENPRSSRQRRPWEEPEPRKALTYNEGAEEAPGFKLPFDPWRLVAAVKRNSGMICAGTLIAAIAGFALAAYLIHYRVTVPIMRKSPNVVRADNADQFSPREYSEQTMYAFMKSGEILRRVAARAAKNPDLARLDASPERIAKAVTVKASPNPDFVLLQVKTFGPVGAMVDLANLYANEIVGYTTEIQREQAGEIDNFLQKKVLEADAKVQALTEELKAYSPSSFMDLEQATEENIKQLRELEARRAGKLIDLETINTKLEVRQNVLSKETPQNTELEKAKAELQKDLLTMTEQNPIVIQKKRQIQMLEQQQKENPAKATGLTPSNPLFTSMIDLQSEKPALQTEIAELGTQITNLYSRLSNRTDDSVAYAMKKSQLQTQKNNRQMLAQREQQARLLTDNTLPAFTVFAPATRHSINFTSRWMKVALLAVMAGLVGLAGSLLLAMFTEAMDTTLKTAEDVARVTKLPVLATLGDLRKMSAAAQVNWAFRTLTLLKGKLSANRDQALVCGLISSTHGEGRSTWVNLLVSAASQRGLRVLTVDTRPTAAEPQTAAQPAPEPAPAGAAAASSGSGPAAKTGENDSEKKTDADGINLPAQSNSTLTPAVLSEPGKVAEQLEDPNAQPVVHIPLPGWVWNLERRKQWQKALEYWRQIDNLVIFVELPPAAEAEAVLLAEHLPQLIWLVGSGKADARETTTQLETLRHAQSNLVGAVLNHAPPPVLNTRITRWFTRLSPAIALLALLHFAPAAKAQGETNQSPARLAIGAGAKHQRAEWQKKLTFGPGDLMDIQMYGNPAMTRTNVMVGPDGRISYLQADNVLATGRTVEELRSDLDQDLSKFYTAPKVIVTPVAFTSKRYYMLGKVNAKGAYILDRPLTIVEAVARAKGLETGLYQRSSVEMADLGHSFIVRNGKKLPINFEKLFLDGDLTQNTTIEPNDYLYFASAAANDIYILGEVMSPGPIGFVPNATVMTAITDRGGYAAKAYKHKVLVIRGSLNEPETFVVNTEAILEGRKKDFVLQPRDIVYVSRRPWSKAEDILDEAASSFIQGAVTTWSGVNIGPIIKHRLLPRTKPSGE
jgi:protein involved in polysaccharide export with SLBB domain/capsular polysaccharide biosynthesis protein